MEVTRIPAVLDKGYSIRCTYNPAHGVMLISPHRNCRSVQFGNPLRRENGCIAITPGIQLSNQVMRHILLIVLLYGGVALLWLFLVPQLTESSIWTANRINHPELAYAVLASAVLGFGWSVVYTGRNLRRRRSK